MLSCWLTWPSDQSEGKYFRLAFHTSSRFCQGLSWWLEKVKRVTMGEAILGCEGEIAPLLTQWTLTTLRQ